MGGKRFRSLCRTICHSGRFNVGFQFLTTHFKFFIVSKNIRGTSGPRIQRKFKSLKITFLNVNSINFSKTLHNFFFFLTYQFEIIEAHLKKERFFFKFLWKTFYGVFWFVKRQFLFSYILKANYFLKCSVREHRHKILCWSTYRITRTSYYTHTRV